MDGIEFSRLQAVFNARETKGIAVGFSPVISGDT
jgi:hypothetical protein